jgi:murein DD-endopeptidase MepM/ murein hydrolase activator NlpD
MLERARNLIRQLPGRVTRRYSVMVHTGPDSGLRHFSLPVLAVPVALALLLFGLIGGGTFLLGWTASRVERGHVAHLRAENRRLVEQIDDFRRTVEVFETQMAESAEMERELRNLANLEPIPADVQRLGVGGPRPLSELQDEASPYPEVRKARAGLSRLDELNRQVDFQHANLREMVAALRDNQEDLDHTPSISPIRSGWYSSRYGTRTDPFTGRKSFHRGLDFSAWTGTPVFATADGHVAKAGRNGELGLLVELDHGNGILTRYGHNSRLLVKVGQEVKRGDMIAEVGSTGRSTSPHCHYEVHVNGRHVNPWRYILDGGPTMDRGA